MNTSRPRASLRGRSRRICQPCRERHLRCDERMEPCVQCIRGKRQCYYIQPPGQSATTQINATRRTSAPEPSTKVLESKESITKPVKLYRRGDIEESVFHEFVHATAPLLGTYYDRAFWLQTILPSAITHDQVFNATLALNTLYTMPLSETLQDENSGMTARIQGRYRSAIKWYCQSVNASLEVRAQDKSPLDMSMLLLTSVLYFHVELRQAHYVECARLMRTAFAIIHSSMPALWNCKDAGVLTSLALLLDLPLTTAVQHSCVAKDHWTSAIVLATKISADIGVYSATHQLHFELANIMYDLDDCIVNHLQLLNTNDLPVEERLQEWRTSHLEMFTQPELDMKTKLRLTRLEANYTWSRMRWDICSNGGVVTKEIGHTCSRILDLYERIVKTHVAADSSFKFPLWTFEAGQGPGLLGVAWHWRDQSVMERSRWIWSHYQQSQIIDDVLGFMQELVSTPYGIPTSLELKLFGRKSITLQQWQAHRLLHALVHRGETASPPLTISG